MLYGELLDLIESDIGITKKHCSVVGRIKDIAEYLGISTVGRLISDILKDIMQYYGCSTDSMLYSDMLSAIVESGGTYESVGGVSLSFNGKPGILKDLKVYGYSTTGRNPTPTNPVTIYHVSDEGIFSVNVSGGGEQTETISFSGALRQGDSINISEGYVYRKRNSIVFDGTESWSDDSSEYPAVRCAIRLTDCEEDMLGRQNKQICTHFVCGEPSYADFDCFSINNDGYIIFSKSDALTVDEWVSFVAEQYANGTPITIEYDMKTIVTEETDKHSLFSYMGTTSITNSEGAYMSVSHKV